MEILKEEGVTKHRRKVMAAYIKAIELVGFQRDIETDTHMRRDTQRHRDRER